MLEILTIISTSWPIAVMVVGGSAAFVVRRSLKQAMDNSAEVSILRSTNATLVRARDD